MPFPGIPSTVMEKMALPRDLMQLSGLYLAFLTLDLEYKNILPVPVALRMQEVDRVSVVAAKNR